MEKLFKVFNEYGMTKPMSLFELTDYDDEVSESSYPSDTLFLQSTGLRDKQDVIVFEGDIVTLSKLVTGKEARYAEVVTAIDCPVKLKALDNGTIYGSVYINRVVGNKYENKELLK